MPDDSLNDPLRLRAALMMACLKLCKGNAMEAVDLQEKLYDTALEELKDALTRPSPGEIN